MRTVINAAPEWIAARRLLLGLLLVMITSIAMAQQRNVQGVVTNAADGNAVSNASVVVKGTNRGTTTNQRGEYTILAAPNETLVASVIGYLPEEKQVGNSTTLNFALTSDVLEMQGVVVTALGIKREEKALGYSISNIKGEELTEALSSNWTDALSGKVAGLNLVRSNSGPAGSNKIILRGENNLTGDNEALIVVDGVVINGGSGRGTAVGGESAYGTSGDNMPADYGSGLNDINPEDIETVTVLKGPGAAALYGQRGAN